MAMLKKLTRRQSLKLLGFGAAGAALAACAAPPAAAPTQRLRSPGPLSPAATQAAAQPATAGGKLEIFSMVDFRR